MPSLYLISCRVFEDELVNIFEKEEENTRLILVENENIEGIEKKLAGASVEYEKISAEDIISKINSTDEFVVVLTILEFALDADPDLLKDKVYMTINENGDQFDGVLIFYGLCGNVLGTIESDFAHLGIPI
ncbi:MAG TPA: DUF1638 domain-containing protein, partial [Methanomethylovorans sp.]|nr:DUF1638 domain-containing protein [Methanomethylovorans sp.]